MHKTLLFLVLLGFVNLAKGQDEKILETYVDEILNLEYKSAYAFASNISDSLLRKELKTLANLHYYAGQENNRQEYTIKIQKESTIQYCMALLNDGFDKLYHNPNKVDNFRSFYDAYIIAKELQIVPLQKMCLHGILEFYHFQYSLTHEQYKDYLDDFGKLAQSDIEKCRYLWYQIYFTFEDVKQDRRIDHTLIIDFDNVVDKLPKNHKFLPEYHSLKAIYFKIEKLYEKSRENHIKVIKNVEKLPHNKYLFFRSYINLAAIATHNKNYLQGLEYIEKAKAYIDYSDTLKSDAQIKRYSSSLYASIGEFEKAYNNLKSSVEILDSTRHYDNNLKNATLNIELNTAEKEKEIFLKSKEIKDKIIAIIILVALVILGSIIVLLYYRNTKRKQRIIAQQLEIEGQKLEKVEKEQELAAIDAMILGQEKEREAIASDLHDNVCALLSAAKMQFEHLTERVESKERQKVEELFDKTKNLLDNAYDEVHSMAYQKNSGIMAKKALLPAIENLIKNNNGINGINIELQHFGLDQRLESSKEIFIFRIIQELIANIVKHAKATEANISITLHKTTISIIVEDNGVGISEEVLLKNKGLGIRNIKKRIQSINGTIDFDSYTNKGTSVVIEIPK
ncbi:sensor histidine kinase [uncultured Kordia sp.]|uniref:sensor histidine kinase n=1 Tax=uncultured Kordia sp. TaxID=507699 RepID=UPI0026034EB5|nr:sensor histidine kinase [uncultured Kordia sp.]